MEINDLTAACIRLIDVHALDQDHSAVAAIKPVYYDITEWSN